jgi:hypothetical protein
MLYFKSIAWKLNPLAYNQQPKFSGKDIPSHDFLLPELPCARCLFPELTTQLPIGGTSYINKCTNTNIWIDHDLIIGFVTLLCHFAHSSSSLLANNKSLPQLVHVSSQQDTNINP